ncbi:hypothetical protein NUW58_g9187 [Xylaria curta]|uniref:Uncharacterized protein n=1 Tax=Xylaria curta TaxID=42375 RepID=A0ACC1N0J4_9PEZI|nr:hypothetical protein NUW58_g9187 [Xylaria curta]
MCDLFFKHGKTGPIFAPQYRLSSRPTSAPFPAAVQDSLTSYLYFCGGNLVIALLRYIAEYGPELDIPPPKCAVIIAPWVAPVKNLWPEIVITSNPNYNSDFLGKELCRWGAKTYIGKSPPEHPYIVPLGQPFKTSVPMFVPFGGAEILAVDGLEWAREMSRVEGNELEIYIEPDAPHDTLLVGHIIGWEESSAKVAQKIEWCTGRWRRPRSGRANQQAARAAIRAQSRHQGLHPRDHVSFAANHAGKQPYVDFATIVNPDNATETYSSRLWAGSARALRRYLRAGLRLSKEVRKEVLRRTVPLALHRSRRVGTSLGNQTPAHRHCIGHCTGHSTSYCTGTTHYAYAGRRGLAEPDEAAQGLTCGELGVA